MSQHNSHNQNENASLSKWVIALCGAIFTLIALDVYNDFQEGSAWAHLIIEVAVLLLSLIGIGYFGWQYYQSTQSEIDTLKQNLHDANTQAQIWREANKELIAGLSAQIHQQFDTWQLTRAEAEVGMLMLKGLSHQEIANVRNSGERTIREQARAIYRKSGVAGRSELSAFFLEDLLLPRQDGSA